MPPANEVLTLHPEALAAPLGTVLSQMAIGHYVSQALYLVAKLGLADLLKDGPRNSLELAAATQTHAPSLIRALRLLASVGVFEERGDGRFALTPLGEPLRADVPGSLRAWVLLVAGVGVQDCWRELEYCVRTGQPAFRRVAPDAPDVYALANADPAATALFDRAVATFAPPMAAAVADAFDFSRFREVMDVGGGTGGLLIGILKAHSAPKGIIIDQPHTAGRAREQIAAAGLTHRCRVVEGSFFDDLPRNADACILKDVLVDWSDERAIAILRNCRAAIPPHGQVLIIEHIYPTPIDRSAASRTATANDVLMMVCTGGRQRSETEFRNLLAAAGFRLTRVIPTTAGMCILQGQPA